MTGISTMHSDRASSERPALPYVAGQALSLKASEGDHIQATITRVYPITVSPVMEVQLNSQTENKRVILKLFDHRFGELRKRHPYNEAVEEAWRDYIRSGEAKTLLDELQSDDERIRNERLGINDEENDSEEEEDSDDDDDEENIAEEEALIFHRTRNFYKDEVRAYTKLRAPQGRSIPKFIDSVILPFTDAPSDLPEEYFHAPGVLLEFVPGFPMTELPLQLPDQPELWGEIARSAIIAVKEINAAGVVHDDCQPRNILVTKTDEGKFRPCLIDFGQSSFKEDWKDTDDVFDEQGWPYLVHLVDNHGAIAVLMMKRIERMTPYKIHIDHMAV